MRALPALAVAALLVIAGCAGPATPTDAGTTATTDAVTATTTGASTATNAESENDGADGNDDADGESGGGDDAVPDADALAVNDTATFENLTAMLEVDAERPTLATRDLSRFFEAPQRPRLVLLGLEEYVENPGEDPHGLATGQGRIYVQPADASPAVVEQVVVHEQFHSIQFQRGWTAAGSTSTTDGQLAIGGAVEGASVWVAGEYTERYQGDGVERQIRMVERAVVEGPDGLRLFRAPYYFGARWTDHHVEDPANVSWVYENPPRTTEQLMHNETAAAEPVRPTAVVVRSDAWTAGRSDRLGEAFVWATLRGELEANRSRTAAAGWGGDAFRTVSATDGEVGSFAWALRWDSERDADEFAAAARDWAAARDANMRFRVVRANATTTLLLGGDATFVERADVALEDGTVVVTRGAAANASAAATDRQRVRSLRSQESSGTS